MILDHLGEGEVADDVGVEDEKGLVVASLEFNNSLIPYKSREELPEGQYLTLS